MLSRNILCLSILITNCAYANDCMMTFHIEPKNSNKTMINQNSGTFSVKDINGKPIVLQWNKIEGKSPELTQQIRDVKEILIETYTQQELEFAHKHPDAVKNEYFLKPLAPLFEKETIDWDIVESQVRAIFHQFFTTTDFAQFCKDDEKQILVKAFDQAPGKMLGFIQFISSSDYPTDSIKAGMFGVATDAKDRGLYELLMTVIFKLVPSVQRIFIHVRSTNEKGLSLYKSWGFIPMVEAQGYWVNLEYVVQNNTYLQKQLNF